MIGKSEQVILEKAKVINEREAKKKAEEYEAYQHEWCRQKLGKYYREKHTSGASDDAFSVFRVKEHDYNNYLELENVGYWHDGHNFIGRTTWAPSNNMEYYEEISEKEYYEWMKFYLFKIHAKFPLDIDYLHQQNKWSNME